MEALKRHDLYRACDPSLFDFKTTDDLKDLDDFVGQDRALQAAKFSFGMKGRGYNLFAFGPHGTGKSSLVRRLLKERIKDMAVPRDWVYVNNFTTPHKPRALSFEAGKARLFSEAMTQLVDDLKATIPQAFEKEEYRQRRDGLETRLKEIQDKAFGDFRKRAEARNVGLLRTPTGFALVPLKEGTILNPDEFKALSGKEQDQRKSAIDELQEELEQIVEELPRMEKEYRVSVRDLNREVTQYAVRHQIMELRKDFKDHAGVQTYLDDVEKDVIDTADDFLPDEQPKQTPVVAGMMGAVQKDFRRYKVNILVDYAVCDEDGCRPVNGAPIVEEDHPTLPNMVGRVESVSMYGTVMTDFTLIKAGALHKANGGYLIVDAHKILSQPFAWEALKRMLQNGRIRIESAAQSYGVSSPMMLEPEPIMLDVKVIMIGDPQLYYMLNHLDPDFHELFKVAADFDDRMERNEDSIKTYARLLGTFVRQEGLTPLDATGVARVVEQGSRICEDRERLTTHMSSIVDLVRESDYWAREEGAKVIARHHVEQAIEAKTYRSDRIRERILDEIHRGTIHIDTAGEVVGQINGLAVLQLDHFMFGRPSRISCTVRMGRGEIVNIEREVALSGPLHSKGVLILTSFLAQRFAKDRPLSLTANIVFEQSYSNIDGDSASSTELYSLLSALADVPIRQSLAVTGSVDQYGHVQAIGGVNEKIEGFFDVCMARGLNAKQGVLIPKDNVKHLMLRADVVDACDRGDFHIYPVETIDQGIEILTGVPAGEMDENGQYPIGTINRLASVRLKMFSRRWFEMARAGAG